MTSSIFSGYGVRNPGARGFTLLEVLLAMAILAVVLTVIYASFSTASRNVEQAETMRDETDLARSLITRLATDVSNAYYKQSIALPMLLCGVKQEVDNPAGGDKLRHDSISLTTLTNWRRPDSKEMELWEVGYFFKEKPEGKGYSLFRREKRELSKDQPPLQGGVEYELTDRVQSLQIRYLRSAPSASTTSADWSDSWNLGNAQGCAGENAPIPASPWLPGIVEITVTLDNGRVYTTQVEVLNKV